MFNITMVFLGFGFIFFGVYLMKIAIYLFQNESLYLPKRHEIIIDPRTGYLKNNNK